MNRTGILFLMVVVLVLSCEKDKYDNLQIAIGHDCGWCTRDDSLYISSAKTSYTYMKLCTTKNSLDKHTNMEEWNDLTDLLDLSAYEKITLNTCFSCADGCDTWICITHDQKSHQIRFANFDSAAIRDIKPFIDRLEEIMVRMHQEIEE